jgi:hypothetical protein
MPSPFWRFVNNCVDEVSTSGENAAAVHFTSPPHPQKAWKFQKVFLWSKQLAALTPCPSLSFACLVVTTSSAFELASVICQHVIHEEMEKRGARYIERREWKKW